MYYPLKNKMFNFLRGKYLAAWMVSRLVNRTGPDFVIVSEPMMAIYMQHDIDDNTRKAMDDLRIAGWHVLLVNSLDNLTVELKRHDSNTPRN